MRKPFNRIEYFRRDYNIEEIEEDPRFTIAKKEFRIVNIVWVVFVFLAMVPAYLLGGGDPADYTYILGLPLWFFACLCGVIATIAIIFFVVKRVFQDMPLDDVD